MILGDSILRINIKPSSRRSCFHPKRVRGGDAVGMEGGGDEKSEKGNPL